jgi:hypothetical protein
MRLLTPVDLKPPTSPARRFPGDSWGKFGRSYFSSAFHSGRMFDEADVDGGTREQPTCQHGNEFGNLVHRFFLPTNSQVTLSIADTLQEKRKLAKSADCVGGANVLGRDCFISTAIGASG